MNIGYIGLGRMGLNMVTRLVDHGHQVEVADPHEAARNAAVTQGAIAHPSVGELVDAVAQPRILWIMVPFAVVDTVLADLRPLLNEGDIVIDGGNSPFRESMRRAEEFRERGVRYLDIGVSGGPEGARTGACLMVGGEREAFGTVEPLLRDIAAADAYKYMGPSGSGHFVKMVHNGIEYGMMEAIAEGFNIMKQGPFDLNLVDVADIYQHQSVVTSRLVGWLQEGFETYGEDLGSIEGKAGAMGEGQWTVDFAREIGADATTIEHAIETRHKSQSLPTYLSKLIQTMRNMFGGHAGQTEITS